MLTNLSAGNNSAGYEGYTAVSMKLGPVFTIPVIIKNYHNETISISFESLDDFTLDQEECDQSLWGQINIRNTRKMKAVYLKMRLGV